MILNFFFWITETSQKITFSLNEIVLIWEIQWNFEDFKDGAFLLKIKYDNQPTKNKMQISKLDNKIDNIDL